MDRISVIIPTLWLSHRTPKLLEDLDQSKYVKEIILIDNNSGSEKRPDDKFLESITKLKIYDYGKNTYVNPAWNIGVSKSSGDILCICNDDVNFDADSLFEEVLRGEDIMGVVGLNHNSYKTDGDGKYRYGHHIGHGWGCILFMKREDYVPIPDQVKLWFGDNWFAEKLSSYNIFPSKQIHSEISTSVNSGFENLNDIVRQDIVEWNKLKSSE